jgi:S1-C subfamily serine protease
VGVGSLIVGDAAGGPEKAPGNMFVPIDRLPPILGDLIADGRAAGPGRPWLGVNADELHGRLFVSRVTPGGPADKAGIKRGDVIVGVNGEQPKSLADFYRKVWAQGPAGANVPLDVLQDKELRRLDIKSINRLDHLKLKSTF